MSTFSFSSLGTWVLVHWCSALLPPIPEDERDYYDILDLKNSNCTLEDVRKAYKKKSLQLHPDKIAQRREMNAAQAAAEYQLVQEAHHVLSDGKKRQLYHAVQRSPTRFKFVNDGMMHPQGMYDNLAQASCVAKSRIVFLGVLLFGILLLQPILIACKVNQIVQQDGGALESTDWIVLLIPWWLMRVTYLGLVVLVYIMMAQQPQADQDSKKTSLGLYLLEQIAWLAGEVALALRWDETLTSDYVVVFVPIYAALALRSLSSLWDMRQVHQRVRRMITQTYLDQKVLEGGRPYEELTPEERQALETQYVLVHVPPDFAVDVEVLPALEEDDLEAMRVEASQEYREAMEVYGKAVMKLLFTLFVATPFVGMVVAKVDGPIDESWWVVFVPFWVAMGGHFILSFYKCCCGTVPGSEITLEHVDDDDDDDEDGGDADRGGPQVEQQDNDNLFASAEGNMREFRSSVKQDGTTTSAETPAGASTTTSAPENDDSAPTTNESSEIPPPPTAQHEESKDEEPEVDFTNAEEPATPTFDDETYRAWKEVYEEAEQSAREAQMKAQGDCCSVMWQLLFLCLLVGKLEKVYDREPDEGDGYNAIWILFPFLLISCCFLSCCACVVYGAGGSTGLDNIVNQVSSTTDGDDVPADEENPEPPAASDPAKTSSNAAALDGGNVTSKKTPSAAAGRMTSGS